MLMSKIILKRTNNIEYSIFNNIPSTHYDKVGAEYGWPILVSIQLESPQGDVCSRDINMGKARPMAAINMHDRKQ